MRSRRWIMAVALSHLLGVLQSGLADRSVTTVTGLIVDNLDTTSRPLNFITWAVIFTLLVVGLLSLFAPWWRKRQSYETLLATILRRLKDTSVARFAEVGVEKALTLQKCPEIEQGWSSSDIRFDHQKMEFHLPVNYEPDYKKYFEQEFRERHGEESKPTCVMLTLNPIAGTNRVGLVLNTKLNRYSYSQFYWNRILRDGELCRRMVNQVVENRVVSFPNNLCLHLVVMTNDKQILITKRSEKVGTFPGAWSSSIEENLEIEDLEGPEDETVKRWMERALEEELGVNPTDFAPHNLKVLSVFLETNRLNTALVGFVALELSSSALSERIRHIPRKDYEFIDHDYMDVPEMARELLSPRRDYHPTSRYRMLMVLLHLFGEARFARKFIEIQEAK